MRAIPFVWAIFSASCASPAPGEQPPPAPLAAPETVRVRLRPRLSIPPDTAPDRVDELVGLYGRAFACLVSDALFPGGTAVSSDGVHAPVVELVGAATAPGGLELELLVTGRRREAGDPPPGGAIPGVPRAPERRSRLPARGRSGTIALEYVPMSDEELALHPCLSPPDRAPVDRRASATRVVVTIEPASPGGRTIDRGALVGDDVLDVDVFFTFAPGHGAYWRARELFDLLRAQGFGLPVGFEPAPGAETFASYGPEVGPLTQVVRIGARDVEVRIRLVYARPDTERDPRTPAGAARMTALLRESLATRDVVVVQDRPDGGVSRGLRLVDPATTPAVATAALGSMSLAPDRAQLLVFDGVDVHAVTTALAANTSKPAGVALEVLATTPPRAPRSRSTYVLLQVLGQLVREGPETRWPLEALHWEAAEIALFAQRARPGEGP